jgi:alpha-1,2-mannosyltransferase
MRAQAELIRPDRGWPVAAARQRPAVAIAAAAFAIALAAYVADVLGHPLHEMLAWFDLGVYRDAGQLARHSPASLYSWQMRPGIRFTYTPFAALLFAGASMLPWAALTWLMTVASLSVVPAAAWLTFGALGWTGRNRVAATLGLSAVGIWSEPVQRALHLGQIELVLMLLVIWDLCQPGRRWWQGAGIGLAAGIKLVPLIFIPYLILTGKLRQAAAAAVAFAATIVIGFVFLPQASATWWLTGYFFHARKVGAVGSLVNQSLLGFFTRAMGTLAAATPVWIGVSVVVGALGLGAAALLHRSGRPVEGWAACALTGLLISPVSWDHHWVWILPILAVLADLAVRARGRARWGYWSLTATLAVIFGGWPSYWSGPRAFVVAKGLLVALVTPGHDGFSFVGHRHGLHRHGLHRHGLYWHGLYRHASRPGVIYHLHGFQVITWNLFVLTGIVLFGLMLCAAWRGRRDVGLTGVVAWWPVRRWLPQRWLPQRRLEERRLEERRLEERRLEERRPARGVLERDQALDGRVDVSGHLAPLSDSRDDQY